MTSTWPALPQLNELVYDLPNWSYPVFSPLAATSAYFGHARLRLYTASDGGHVAIVENSGPGLSVTNGADHIWASLTEDFPGPLTQIELYRCASDGSPGVHFNQYTGDDTWSGHRWRKLSDIDPAHPDYDEVAAWVKTHREVIVGAEGKETPGRAL